MQIYERLDKILPKIQDKRFRENKGLGNEIGYYIFDYNPSDELIVRNHIKFLKQKINNDSYGFKIKEFDLYEVMLELLDKKNYLEKVIKIEKEKGTYYAIKAISSTLRITLKNDLIIDYIRKSSHENDIVFITGVGKAWPIIRSHLTLSSLHSVIDQVPLIMFFPGTYTGLDLSLFNEINDKNYYRAFKLIEK